MTKTTRALQIIHITCIIGCLIIGYAETTLSGHVNIGGITIAFNETPVQYTALAINASQLMGK